MLSKGSIVSRTPKGLSRVSPCDLIVITLKTKKNGNVNYTTLTCQTSAFLFIKFTDAISLTMNSLTMANK